MNGFANLAVQGTSGAGGALLPFGRIVVNRAGGRAVVYHVSGRVDRSLFAVVGVKDGIALGIVFGNSCAP